MFYTCYQWLCANETVFRLDFERGEIKVESLISKHPVLANIIESFISKVWVVVEIISDQILFNHLGPIYIER